MYYITVNIQIFVLELITIIVNTIKFSAIKTFLDFSFEILIDKPLKLLKNSNILLIQQMLNPKIVVLTSYMYGYIHLRKYLVKLFNEKLDLPVESADNELQTLLTCKCQKTHENTLDGNEVGCLQCFHKELNNTNLDDILMHIDLESQVSVNEDFKTIIYKLKDSNRSVIFIGLYSVNDYSSFIKMRDVVNLIRTANSLKAKSFILVGSISETESDRIVLEYEAIDLLREMNLFEKPLYFEIEPSNPHSFHNLNTALLQNIFMKNQQRRRFIKCNESVRRIGLLYESNLIMTVKASETSRPISMVVENDVQKPKISVSRYSSLRQNKIKKSTTDDRIHMNNPELQQITIENDYDDSVKNPIDKRESNKKAARKSKMSVIGLFSDVFKQ